MQSWLDALKVAHARRLAELAVESPILRPAAQLADGQQCTRREAEAIIRRAATLSGLPLMEGALLDGRVTAGHVDALTRATRALDEPGRATLHEREAELVELAGSCTPEVFAREIERQVRNLSRDDGVDELTRQRRGDAPAAVARPRHGDVPAARQCSTRSPGWRSATGSTKRCAPCSPNNNPTPARPTRWRRSITSAPWPSQRLLCGGTVVDRPDDVVLVGGGYELTVLIDEHTLHHGRHPDTTIDADEPGIDLPVDTVRRIACIADITPSSIDDNGVPLRLGRTTRLASRAQRRALRVMYPTCAIPGCEVPSSYCQPHHVHWWRHHGTTNLDNLLPLCSRHHHNVHEGGWVAGLAARPLLHHHLPRRRNRTRTPTRSTPTTSDGHPHRTDPTSRRSHTGRATSTSHHRPASVDPPPSRRPAQRPGPRTAGRRRWPTPHRAARRTRATIPPLTNTDTSTGRTV